MVIKSKLISFRFDSDMIDTEILVLNEGSIKMFIYLTESKVKWYFLIVYATRVLAVEGPFNLIDVILLVVYKYTRWAE